MLQMRRLTGPIRLITVFAGAAATACMLAAAGPGRFEHRRVPGCGVGAGLGGTTDPSDLVAAGQSVCPMLSEPGQNAADAAAKVADTTGMSLGGANMFTGLAISFLCPRVLESVGNGESPIPLGLLGF